MKMNRTELIAAMAEKAGVSKKDADNLLKAFIYTVEGAVKANDKVQLMGFGTFESRERAAREGKNPRTGEKITIAAQKYRNLRLVKHLRIYLNNYKKAVDGNDACKLCVFVL